MIFAPVVSKTDNTGVWQLESSRRCMPLTAGISRCLVAQQHLQSVVFTVELLSETLTWKILWDLNYFLVEEVELLWVKLE